MMCCTVLNTKWNTAVKGQFTFVVTMSSCCPASSEPARAASPHSGAIKKSGNTTLYVTGPANAKAGVLAFPDIFGPDSGRSKSDADALGKIGYVVVLVDLVDGNYADPDDGANRMEWLKKYPVEDKLLPKIQDAVKFLQDEVKVERIASYGYCWGSWVGAVYSASETSAVNSHVSFHPSWIVENLLNGEGAADKLAERVKAAQLLLAAENDTPFVKPNGSVHKILQERADIGPKSDVVEFPDMKHGWVNRGDIADAAVKAGVKKAWHDFALPFIKAHNPL